jgi:uncharacterized protein
VFATPTFDITGLLSVRKLIRRAALSASWCCVAVAVFSAPVAAADETEPKTDFFSYFPAPPELKFPKIEIVPFWTSDFKVARRAYRDGNYSRAHEYFQKASEDGNVTADWYLGHMYRLGRGVPVDPSVAYTYYSRVAEAYDPDEPDKTRLRIAVDSELRIAIYQRVGVPGAGIAADPQRSARTFLRLASGYGHPLAMYALGEMNISGDGLQKNPQQGLKWLMAAARKRNPEAEALLGDIYEVGKYVRSDETRSLMWYMLAVENASESEHTHIIQRAKLKFAGSSEDVRLEADARARVWSEQFPSGKNQE